MRREYRKLPLWFDQAHPHIRYGASYEREEDVILATLASANVYREYLGTLLRKVFSVIISCVPFSSSPRPANCL